MYLVKKGTAPNQAHVGIPDGLYEEEHGRQGFSGPSSHLYHTYPPTAWSRIEGPLRPRAFTCTELLTPDSRSADGRPVTVLGRIIGQAHAEVVGLHAMVALALFAGAAFMNAREQTALGVAGREVRIDRRL